MALPRSAERWHDADQSALVTRLLRYVQLVNGGWNVDTWRATFVGWLIVAAFVNR